MQFVLSIALLLLNFLSHSKTNLRNRISQFTDIMLDIHNLLCLYFVKQFCTIVTTHSYSRHPLKQKLKLLCRNNSLSIPATSIDKEIPFILIACLVLYISFLAKKKISSYCLLTVKLILSLLRKINEACFFFCALQLQTLKSVKFIVLVDFVTDEEASLLMSLETPYNSYIWRIFILLTLFL